MKTPTKAMCAAQAAILGEQLRAATTPVPPLTPAQRDAIAAWAAIDYSTNGGGFYLAADAIVCARGDVCGCCAQPIAGDAYKVRGFWFRAECLRRARS